MGRKEALEDVVVPFVGGALSTGAGASADSSIASSGMSKSASRVE